MDFLENALNLINKYSTFTTANINVENEFIKKLDICFGVDAAFVRPMGVTITSLAENNPELLLKFHIFFGLINENQLSKLKQLTEKYNNIVINLYAVDQEKFNALPTNARMSSAVYFRIITPLVLSAIDRILYLDSDIICLNNIEELITLDIGDKTVAAVLCEIENERLQNLGLPRGSYFNSGVMIIDIKKWNSQDISKKTLQIKQSLIEANSPKIFFTHDQDSLNVALHGKAAYLPKKWNYELYGDIPTDTVFLHYSGSLKPWRCTYEREIQSYYLKYEKISPWRDMGLELPITYPEARMYSKMLLKKGRIFEAVKWFIKLAKMRNDSKKNKSQLGQKFK